MSTGGGKSREFQHVCARTRGGAAARRILATVQEWASEYRIEFGSVRLEDLLNSAEALARIANLINDEFAALIADVFAENRID